VVTANACCAVLPVSLPLDTTWLIVASIKMHCLSNSHRLLWPFAIAIAISASWLLLPFYNKEYCLLLLSLPAKMAYHSGRRQCSICPCRSIFQFAVNAPLRQPKQYLELPGLMSAAAAVTASMLISTSWVSSPSSDAAAVTNCITNQFQDNDGWSHRCCAHHTQRP